MQYKLFTYHNILNQQNHKNWRLDHDSKMKNTATLQLSFKEGLSSCACVGCHEKLPTTSQRSNTTRLIIIIQEEVFTVSHEYQFAKSLSYIFRNSCSGPHQNASYRMVFTCLKNLPLGHIECIFERLKSWDAKLH